LIEIKSNFVTELPQWRDRTIRILSALINEDELKLLAKINGSSWELEHKSFEKFLEELEYGITETPEFYIINEQQSIQKYSKTKAKKTKSKKVFVVHGHDSLAKTEVARTIEKVGLEAIILHEQANEGKTIIEKFERDATQVDFAVVIFTPDDIGYPKNKTTEKKPRARQNVVLELGYFSGILGRSNVCVLYKDDIEVPSDYLGVVYINLDREGSWKFKLAKELKQAGLSIDLNKLI
jgi:predicted nucleotide-binding protein